MMPIVAKSVLQARREAAAQSVRKPEVELAAEPVKPGAVSCEPIREGVIDPDVPPKPVGSSPKRRGHAQRDENGKFMPTGPYPHGFASTPEHTRFKPGCKPGPGRPKGSLSHDALVRKLLDEKREITIRGKRRLVSARELVVMTTLKAAVEGKDRYARAYALAQNERLYSSGEPSGAAPSAAALSASDQLSLAEYEAELREQLLAELRAELQLDAGDE